MKTSLVSTLLQVAGGALLTGWLGAAEPDATAPPLYDFDHDGRSDRLVTGENGAEIQTANPEKGVWETADFQLPSGIVPLDGDGRYAGLLFVDLNGDGFDDILFSNDDRYAIHLWTKNVQPHLGWTKGWTQFVKSGNRTGDPNEPPSLVGATVEISEGQLVVSHGPAGTTLNVPLKGLIAFSISQPRSPEEALSTFQLQPGFRIELVAAEPVVIDPVAFDWGADGRLWVVEMRDYPSGMDGRGSPGGVVKSLEDRDGDGVYDRAVPFIEGIGFPSSLMPWRDGLLIAAAPDILHAVDTDGDGRADVREVLFTGFRPGNQQHRVNGFELGLDGWIYAANGDSGGRVTSVKTGKTLDIRGRDVRFRPDTGEIETVSAQTQYGRRRDDWGNWFGNNNPTWLWHVTLPEHYLRRNPQLAVQSVKRILANDEDSTRVFPVSPELVRPNQPWSINHVTSACSPTPYRDALFGDAFGTSVFISEPVHNAVHREVLERDGGTFTSHRAAGERASEFLASMDNWFRPTTTKVGPDGALYVADMYRASIEHPEWISPEMLARIDVRAGADRGRLYRVVPEATARRAIPNLAALSDDKLAQAMNSPNGWQRDTVQRLLMERRSVSAANQLEELLEPAYSPKVRVQALATLGVLRQLRQPALVRGLQDPHFAVRCEALRQSESFASESDAPFSEILQLIDDGHPAVRLQAAFTLGNWPFSSVRPALEKLALSAGNDELLRIAILSSSPADSDLFHELNRAETSPRIASPVVALTPSTPDRARLISNYSNVNALTGNAVRGRQHFETLCATCHRFKGNGYEVGPDLDTSAAKTVDWLVSAILDPSQSIEARFRPWTIELASGESLSGIITAESANNLVLRMAGGVDQAILRTQIAATVPQKESLMPSGFESALAPQDMADLLAWLRAD